ncbi:MAG: TIGR00282 family metallophosphoesterase [Candidatus Andersenbacteria bacterium]
MRFLIFGDVVGQPGRAAVTQALPDLKREYEPDSVIINIENIAHGVGISPSSVAEALAWQADVYTTGDHAWDNKAGTPLLNDPKLPIIRPANYPAGVAGRGYHLFTKGATTVAVINLQGQVFFKNHPHNPFHTIDTLLKQSDIAAANIVLIDFHAEATSEKRALAWHTDGRVSAIWGTHTHVPTADAQVFPKGLGYISDVGMNGNYHSIIGVDPSGPLKSFLTQTNASFTLDNAGPLEVGALLLEIDPSKHTTTTIAHIRKIINA